MTTPDDVRAAWERYDTARRELALADEYVIVLQTTDDEVESGYLLTQDQRSTIDVARIAFLLTAQQYITERLRELRRLLVEGKIGLAHLVLADLDVLLASTTTS
jgi:hypothetical protein